MTAEPLPLTELVGRDVHAADVPAEAHPEGGPLSPAGVAASRPPTSPLFELDPAPAVPAIVVVAYGKPITQGSKTRNRYGGVRADNAKTLKPWREAVKTAALEVMQLADRLTGPVEVRATFSFDRPTGHYRTGRNATLLRDNAPLRPSNRSSGDGDKLLRACFDALTDAGVWVDDSQVVDFCGRKVWAGEHVDALHIPGVRLEVLPVRS
jgi:Holliday junction resolvase RusA-like endonuclease